MYVLLVQYTNIGLVQPMNLGETWYVPIMMLLIIYYYHVLSIYIDTTSAYYCQLPMKDDLSFFLPGRSVKLLTFRSIIQMMQKAHWRLLI